MSFIGCFIVAEPDLISVHEHFDKKRERETNITINSMYDVFWGKWRDLGINACKNFGECFNEVLPFLFSEAIDGFFVVSAVAAKVKVRRTVKFEPVEGGQNPCI